MKKLIIIICVIAFMAIGCASTPVCPNFKAPKGTAKVIYDVKTGEQINLTSDQWKAMKKAITK